jgi:hypothetical protein
LAPNTIFLLPQILLKFQLSQKFIVINQVFYHFLIELDIVPPDHAPAKRLHDITINIHSELTLNFRDTTYHLVGRPFWVIRIAQQLKRTAAIFACLLDSFPLELFLCLVILLAHKKNT